MINTLKPYPDYKESDQPWSGKIPSHWGQRRVKNLFHERSQKGFQNEPLLAATQRKGVILKEDYGARTVTASKDFHLLKLVEVGDFVVSLRSFEGGFEIAHNRGIISPAYTILCPTNSANRSYFKYFFKSKHFIQSLSLFVTGIREGQNIDYQRLSRAYFPLPTKEEQENIGKFLDWANGRLEKAIRAKRKIIALLNEQKQAIIHRAVTRGLDPNVPLKPSGIPWLGDIPQHWETRRVKQLTQILRGKFTHRPRNDPSLYDGPYPFIQTGAVAKAQKFIKDFKQTLNERGLNVSKLFPKGTLCMTIAANIGDVAILDFDACFPDSVVGFIPKQMLHRDFLYYSFRCLKEELLNDAPVNTQGNLNIERIGVKWLSLPPMHEQKRIYEYIETETSSFNVAIEKAEKEIELLREYRKRLVTDVVTGKLDVRKAAANLPDEPEDMSDNQIDGEIDEAELEDEGNES